MCYIVILIGRMGTYLTLGVGTVRGHQLRPWTPLGDSCPPAGSRVQMHPWMLVETTRVTEFEYYFACRVRRNTAPTAPTAPEEKLLQEKHKLTTATLIVINLYIAYHAMHDEFSQKFYRKKFTEDRQTLRAGRPSVVSKLRSVEFMWRFVV